MPRSRIGNSRRIDPTVVITIFACCAFLTLHLVWGGATILLCVSIGTMLIVLLTAILRKRRLGHQTHVLYQRKESVRKFAAIKDVDDTPFWSDNNAACNDAISCPICLTDSQHDFQRSKCCNNSFHRTCILKYIFYGQTSLIACPICRAEVAIHEKRPDPTIQRALEV